MRKGTSERNPEKKKHQDNGRESSSRPEWCEAIAVVINSKAVAQQGYFRWHDAGDIQSHEHLQKICEVCKLTPKVKHWMPTREAQFLKDIDPAQVPDNLIIRMSSHMIDQGPVSFWPWTSTVGSKTRTCPAPDQGNSCGRCSTCRNRQIPNIEYGTP